jgi:hypothetical protein
MREGRRRKNEGKKKETRKITQRRRKTVKKERRNEAKMKTSKINSNYGVYFLYFVPSRLSSGNRFYKSNIQLINHH